MNSKFIVLFFGLVASSYSSGFVEQLIKSIIDGKAATLEREAMAGNWSKWFTDVLVETYLGKIEERRGLYFKSLKRVHDIGNSEDVNTVSAQFVSSFTKDVEKVKIDLKVTYDNFLSQEKAFAAKKLESFENDLRKIEARIPNVKPYAESTIARMHVKAEERFADSGKKFEEISAPLDEALQKGIASLKVYNTVFGNANEEEPLMQKS